MTELRSCIFMPFRLQKYTEFLVDILQIRISEGQRVGWFCNSIPH